jgi:hypothetical protein
MARDRLNPIPLGRNVGFDSLDDVAHISQHIVEPIRQLEVPIHFTNFDRYRRGAVNLHVHFRTWRDGIDRDAKEHCAILKKPLAVLDCSHAVAPDKCRCPEIINTFAEKNQISVLIRVLEAAKDAQVCDVGIGAELVGLHSLDECYCLEGHTFDGAVETAPPIRVTDNVASLGIPLPDIPGLDWEKRAPLLSLRDECDGEMVERRPKVEQEVADDDRHGRIGRLCELNSVLPNIQITLGMPDSDDFVGVAVGVSAHIGFEFIEVLFRPSDLEPPGLGPSHGW